MTIDREAQRESTLAAAKVLRLKLKLMGERFENLTADYQADVKKLLSRRVELVELARAINELDNLCSEMETEQLPL